MSSSPSKPLQRAHTLSSQASTLLRPSSVPTSTLHQALTLYSEAVQLYETAQRDMEGKGSVGEEANTLKMLVTQHRKLLRDVERRIATTQKELVTGGSPARSPQAQNVNEGRPIQRRSVTEVPLVGIREGMNMPGGFGISPSSGFSNRLSPPRTIPPFAFRPSSIAHPANPMLSGQPSVEPPSLSPLYSSSSTSSSTFSSTEESFIHFGSPPDSLDPFSRFWGMLENMIEEVSGPVMFATAPVNQPTVDIPTEAKVKGDRASQEHLKTKGKGKGKGKADDDEESFYVVKKGKGKGKETNSQSSESEDELKGRQSNTGPSKTAEELSFENESLKTSLDSLASHAQSLEMSNRNLQMQLEEREKGLKVIMEGLKREAGRVKAGQEVWKSQILAGSLIAPGPGPGSIPASTTRIVPTSTISGSIPSKDDSSKKRIKELEDEVRQLKNDNEKQKSQIDRYKERFEKIKSNAKAKKEAKLAIQPDTSV
ncbi:uncharacterized protein IL334_000373 [Kwoniella shivajii]|uniref:MIT domain-containing protein n=1 Tax=Kwoniella shivajii TaxID=564305 RepID=A0ABZ1CP54_9TREE|nr:hypothetical protein IL334_000373 [Kwoniella shivajii]